MTLFITAAEAADPMQVVLSPPSTFEQLIIFTGTTANFALGGRRDNLLVRDHGVQDLTIIHNMVFNPDPARTKVLASASPAAMHGSSGASETSWAVENVRARVDPSNGHLLLETDLAAQGIDSLLLRYAYQVFVMTTGAKIVEFTAIPSIVNVPQDQSATFSLKVQLEKPAVGLGEPVRLQWISNELSGEDAGFIPHQIVVPVGQSTGSVPIDTGLLTGTRASMTSRVNIILKANTLVNQEMTSVTLVLQ